MIVIKIRKRHPKRAAEQKISKFKKNEKDSLCKLHGERNGIPSKKRKGKNATPS